MEATIRFKYLIKIILTFIAQGVVNIAFSQATSKRYSLLITDATVVDVVHGQTLKNKLLAISGDTIKVIDDSRNARKYRTDQVVNAAGRYVLPGLWDMHVHFRGGDELINENKALLPLFLAHGITTVRDAGGDMTPALMEWRKQIKAGTLAGPKIFTSGPKLDGPKPVWQGSLEVQTPRQVADALDSLENLKVDYVKIYDSSISRDAYLGAVAETQKRGLKVTSHLPVTVKLSEAVNAGLDAVEHMYFVLIASSAKEYSLFQNVLRSQNTAKPVNFWTVVFDSYYTYDPGVATQVFKDLAQNNTAVVPTLHVQNISTQLRDKDFSSDAMRAYIGPGIQATYQRRVRSAKQQSEQWNQFLKDLQQRLMTMIPQMQAAGVTLLAGSDSGPYNSYIYPGSSLHEELKLLVAAGLTPLQALQTATINGARFMGVDHFYGTVQAGKSSDIIILNSNPLQDITAVGTVEGVVSNTRYYSRKDLDKLMEMVKQ